MALAIFPALVLKSYETGNTSEVVHTLSADHGRLSVYARGLRNPKNRHRGILQPLALVELSVSLREGSELANLREASTIEDHAAILHDFERFTLAALLADVAAACCAASQPAPEIFGALLMALHELDPRSHRSAPAAACAGLVTLLAASGYEPTIAPELLRPWPKDQPRPTCFWIDIESARIGLRERQPSSPPQWPTPVLDSDRSIPLPPESVRFLHTLADGASIHPLANDHAMQLIEALTRLAEFHLETGLKGADFWRRINGTAMPGGRNRQ